MFNLDGSSAGTTSISNCYISVSAGKYIGTANSSTQSSCGTGTYRAAHTVNYGSTSSCTACPSPYVNGAGATAQSGCKWTVRPRQFESLEGTAYSEM